MCPEKNDKKQIYYWLHNLAETNAKPIPENKLTKNRGGTSDKTLWAGCRTGRRPPKWGLSLTGAVARS